MSEYNDVADCTHRWLRDRSPVVCAICGVTEFEYREWILHEMIRESEEMSLYE